MSLFLLGLVLVFGVGVVGAITCSEADYDSDDDVDAMDILKYNQCNPNSEQYVLNATWDCDFFDFNDDSVVDDVDGDLMSEWTYQECPVEATCTDSDDGKDYYVKGFVNYTLNGTSELFYDICGLNIDNVDYPDKLEEKICEGDIISNVKYDCPAGCGGGACIESDEEGNETQKCIDSDGGKNYYKKGKVKINSGGSVFEYEDNCYLDSDGTEMLAENFCENDDLTILGYECSNGCEDGVCILGEDVKQGYKHAYFQCYDGEESKSTGREACKTAEFWEKFADNFCESHCKKYKDVEKCGVNSFSITEECWTDGSEFISEEITSEEEGEEIEPKIIEKTEEFIGCKNSCPLDNKCYPFGYRKSGKFCSDEGSFVGQLKAEESCDNNFECDSNVCVDGECISGGLLRRIINWFRKLFG
jgi:hypothetical protein